MFWKQTETVSRIDVPAPAPSREREYVVHEKPIGAIELGLWLRALRSFFNLRNHPLNDTETPGGFSHDFNAEASIAQDVLLHCSRLMFALAERNAPAPFYEAGVTETGVSAILLEQENAGGFDEAGARLCMLAEVISDACNLCRDLLRVPSLGHSGWASFGNILVRQLDASEAARKLIEYSLESAGAKLQQRLRSLTESLAPDELGADMLAIFTLLTRLLEHLLLIEKLLDGDSPLKRTLPVFTLVREDAGSLLELIENRGLHVQSLGEEIAGALDGTAYAIRMELRKAFEHELVGLSSLRQSPHVYARVENAHGLLRDCFQQSVVALGQILDAQLEGKHLFSTFETKLEQSLVLRRELWTLLQLVRGVEKGLNEKPLTPMLERLAAFRDGSMRYLMYKDWEACERFVEELSASRRASETDHLLHRFEAFLETLLGQVNMRAVLADRPFDPALPTG